jgi:phenylpropionate dioxygenase-like ring-hydroxylating dioxygenase large terminal subunit
MALESALWPHLWDYWHPVSYSADLGPDPVPARLLGVPIVLARLDDQLTCLHDLCVHRGTPLSLGWISGDTLTCAYHGWRYRADGACVHIPARPNGVIPRRARVAAYHVAEKYGLIWVCLGTPQIPIPEFPEYGDPTYRITFMPPVHWKCSAARQTENFIDQAHFPWVHEGILGDRAHPESIDADIERHGEELRYEYTDRPNPMHPLPHRRVYRLHRPFTIHQRKVRSGEDDVEASYSPVCPVSAGESAGFLIIARNFRLDPVEEARRYQLDVLIQTQDQRIVEAQRPEELPIDLSAELHIKGPDAVAVAYRRLLAELGVDSDARTHNAETTAPPTRTAQ